MEVFSRWAGPGEKEGLEALVADFRGRNPGIEFDNAAVAGGAGTVARTVLATRLENDGPPDSYKVHAGLELDSDIKAGYVEDVRYLYDQQRCSVPARLDADTSKYTGYLALAIAEWTDASTRVVGSLTHGVVAGTQRSAAIDTVLAAFVQDSDPVKFAAAAGHRPVMTAPAR